MSDTAINFGIFVRLPREVQKTREALILARDSAEHSQRWEFVMHMVEFILRSLLSCPVYFENAIVNSLHISVYDLQGTVRHSLQQGLNSYKSLLCSMLGICLLATTIFVGVGIIPRHIITCGSFLPAALEQEPLAAMPTQAQQAAELEQEPIQDRIQELLTTLSKELLKALLAFRALPVLVPAERLQERLLGRLQYQLPGQLQTLLIGLSPYLHNAHIQRRLLPRLLKGWLLKLLRSQLPELLQDPLPEDLSQDPLQKQFQIRIQRQLSDLRQTLNQALHRDSYQSQLQELCSDPLQNQLQDLLQDRHQKRFMGIYPEQLRHMLQALRQELLDREEFPLPDQTCSILKTRLHALIAKWHQELRLSHAQINIPHDLSPRRWIEGLRPNLRAGLLLDLLSDWIPELFRDLSQDTLQTLFLKDRLPKLQQTLRQILYTDLLPEISTSPLNQAKRQEFLQALRQELLQNTQPSTLAPSALAN